MHDTTTENGTSCVRSELREVCKLLDEAGVPAESKWTSLIMYLRSLKYNEALAPAQKAAVQDMFVDILKNRDFSDLNYRSICQAQEQIIASPYLQKLQMALGESAQLIREFGALLERRRGDVQDLGDFTVKTVGSGAPPEQAVRSLRDAFRRLVQVMDEDTRNLKAIARTDDLTGLANRRGFDEHIQLCAEGLASCSTPLSLLMADIDLFKDINDTYGHSVGDQVLRSVARNLAEETAAATDGKGYCARYGGEEFVVVLNGLGQDAAQVAAERIRQRIERVAFDLRKPGSKGKAARVQRTISIGVCQIDPDWGDVMVQKMLDAADAALYEAKRTGRNKVIVSSECGCAS